MCRCPKVSRLIANAENDQICLVFLGGFENAVDWVSVPYGRFRSTPKLCPFWNDLVELMHYVRHGILGDP
jgi:hypothetical protein